MVVLSFIFAISFVLSSGFVSAAAADIATSVNNGIDGFVEVAEPILRAIIGETDSGDVLFVKALFFITICCIVWLIIRRVPFFNQSPGIAVLLSSVISLISIRFLGSEAIIRTLALPYSALGSTILAALPFVLAFVAVNTWLNQPHHATYRKLLWALFAAIFIGLWVSTYAELYASSSEHPWALYVYPLAALLSFLMIVFDGTFAKWRAKTGALKAVAHSKRTSVRELKRELRDLQEDLRNNTITRQDYDRDSQDIMSRIQALSI